MSTTTSSSTTSTLTTHFVNGLLTCTATTNTYKSSEDLDYDLGMLTCLDIHPIEQPITKQKLIESSRENVQFLLNKLFELEGIRSDENGLLVKLPDTKIHLPREKPVPKEKELTRWQQFMLSKGLKLKSDKNREKLVYDAVHDEFRPRAGWGKANNKEETDWIIPAKEGDEKYEDPFLQRKIEKKERQQKLTKKQIKNIESGASTKEVKDAMKLKEKLLKHPSSVEASSAFKLTNVNGGRLSSKRANVELKNDFLNAYDFVRTSTASMGKFDKRVAGEDKLPVKKGINHLVRSGMEGDLQVDEKTKAMKLASRILKEKSKKKVQLKTSAVNIFQKLTEKDSRKQKKTHVLAQAKDKYKKKLKQQDGSDYKIEKNKK
ncbi:hypothetical protein ABK040_001376 [Willaertia magna]